jgi:hypothetical protein
MTHDQALVQDVRAVLPRGGQFLSGQEVAKLVAPLREREVRTLLYALAKRGELELNRGGGGWPWVYGRSALERRI